jgi:hypothetical protein
MGGFGDKRRDWPEIPIQFFLKALCSAGVGR